MQRKANDCIGLLFWRQDNWHQLRRLNPASDKDSGREVRPMPHDRWERIGGPIRGLRLPYETWEALRRVGITTLERLRAMADEIHTLPGIGPKTAQMIREEFARVTSSRKRR